jgi:hypothetical protein
MIEQIEPTTVRVSVDGTDTEIIVHIDADGSGTMEAVLKVAGEVTAYDYSGGADYEVRQVCESIGRWIVDSAS